jgi:DNA-binding phage protein
MTKRSNDWNEGLARDLRDPAFAREFLVAAVDEGVPLQHALGKVIRAKGATEFALQVDMSSANILRAINPARNPSHQTLNRLLQPFGFRIALAAIEPRARKRRRAV